MLSRKSTLYDFDKACKVSRITDKNNVMPGWPDRRAYTTAREGQTAQSPLHFLGGNRETITSRSGVHKVVHIFYNRNALLISRDSLGNSRCFIPSALLFRTPHSAFQVKGAHLCFLWSACKRDKQAWVALLSVDNAFVNIMYTEISLPGASLQLNVFCCINIAAPVTSALTVSQKKGPHE